MNKLLVICGPTATGKTALAVYLAQRFNGELVSADSRQVYKGLDIISGKDIQNLSGIPMWLYDVVSVGQQFSVSLYRKLVIPVIDGIHARGKLPIIVGGTGLYIRSIIDPPETIDIPPDMEARAVWNTLSVASLQQKLQEIDAKRLARMNQSDRNNPRRLIRALEITAWQKLHTVLKHRAHTYDWYWIGLKCSMEELKKRITIRVRNRWDQGALDEARRFPTAIATGMDALKLYRDGSLTQEQAQAAWVREEVAYAKRQMTWFNKNPAVKWFDAGSTQLIDMVEKRIQSWYTAT